MILRIYLFSLYSTLLLSLGLFGLVVFNVDPYKSPFWMILIFYLTFFLFWLAFFGLIGFYLKIWASNREVIFAHLVPTLRQASLIALFFAGLLFLMQLKALNWWVIILLTLAILMLELSFRRKKNI